MWRNGLIPNFSLFEVLVANSMWRSHLKNFWRILYESFSSSGLVKGCAMMGLSHHPDLFHLLRPLAMFGERFYRKALAAIAWEYERGSMAIGRSEAVINKRSAAYEAAKAEAEEKIRRYDNFC